MRNGKADGHNLFRGPLFGLFQSIKLPGPASSTRLSLRSSCSTRFFGSKVPDEPRTGDREKS